MSDGSLSNDGDRSYEAAPAEGCEVTQGTGIRIVKPTCDTFANAQRRAQELAKQYQLGVSEIITSLMQEVETMPIASRFSTTRTIADNLETRIIPIHTINPILVHLTEAEFKRAQLILNLRELRTRIGSDSHRLMEVIMDIEATKAEFTNDGDTGEEIPKDI